VAAPGDFSRPVHHERVRNRMNAVSFHPHSKRSMRSRLRRGWEGCQEKCSASISGLRPGGVAFWCCLIGLARRSSTMTSLHHHGPKEARKQIHFRMMKSGLTTIKVSVTRKFGRLNVQFSGSDEEVNKAQKILAAWG
jgi:hypothetical protein